MVLTVDQFFGHGGQLLEQWKQDRKRLSKNWHMPSVVVELSLHIKQRCLRNCEKGMEFMTCDECKGD